MQSWLDDLVIDTSEQIVDTHIACGDYRQRDEIDRQEKIDDQDDESDSDPFPPNGSLSLSCL